MLRAYARVMRVTATLATLLLVAFLVCLAAATAAQVRHNQAAGPRGHAPHDRPIGPGYPRQ
jgi:hypothetical protein